MATKIGAFQGDLTPDERLTALLKQCDDVAMRPERLERIVAHFLRTQMPHGRVTRNGDRLSITAGGRTRQHTARRPAARPTRQGPRKRRVR